MHKQNGFFGIVLTLGLVLVAIVVLMFTNPLKLKQDAKELADQANLNKPDSVDLSMPSDLNLQITPSGAFTLVKNVNYKFSVQLPSSYTISGNAENFAVSTKGDMSAPEGTPDLLDFASLHFRILPLEAPSVYAQARRDYISQTEIMSEKPLDTTKEVLTVSLGGISSYTFDCPFLVEQVCYYVPLKDDTSHYLLILKSFSDDANRGYDKALKSILSSFSYMN